MTTRDEKWMRYLEHAVLVFAATGAVPRGGKDPGPWVSAQRTAARTGQNWMTRHRQALLDEYLPGWREAPPQRQKSWPEVAAELRSYVHETGRLPGQSGDTPDERRFGAWLTAQRVAHHGAALKPARAAWLSANIPNWEGRGPREVVWQQTARELSTWITETGRWPQRRNSSADERRLAFWLKNRRDDHRAGRLSAERIALLDKCASGWCDAASSAASQA